MNYKLNYQKHLPTAIFKRQTYVTAEPLRVVRFTKSKQLEVEFTFSRDRSRAAASLWRSNEFDDIIQIREVTAENF